MKHSMMLKWRYAATMLLCTIMASWSFADLSMLPFADDFESYVIGTPLIDGTNGWYASDTNVLVQGDVVYEGTQAADTDRIVCCLIGSIQLPPPMQPTFGLWVQPCDTPAPMIRNARPIFTAFYLNSNGYCFARCRSVDRCDQYRQGLDPVPEGTDTWGPIDRDVDYVNKKWYSPRRANGSGGIGLRGFNSCNATIHGYLRRFRRQRLLMSGFNRAAQIAVAYLGIRRWRSNEEICTASRESNVFGRRNSSPHGGDMHLPIH